jgi:predicted permease
LEVNSMNAWMQDLRYAARQLRKSPAFTLTAWLTLALGIGVTAAVYSVIQTVLLEPLPYPDADSLVGVAFTWPQERPNAEQTGPTYELVRDNIHAFSSVALMDDSGPAVNLSVRGGNPMQVTSLGVSEGYFRTLGVNPALGRSFLPEEDKPGGARAVILSDGLWSRLFGRDPSIVGRTIRLNEESFTVVGVMPATFAATAETAPGVMGTPDLWRPLQLGPKDPGYDGDNYEMIARLKPGISLAQVQPQLTALEQPFYARYPGYKHWTNSARVLHQFRVWKLQDVVVSDVRRSLLTVMGGVVAVLLIACLNLAGLMTARAMRRAREISLRSALGATRGQLLRLVVCEGLSLALGGAVLATFVAAGATRLLLENAPLAIPVLRGAPSLWLLAAVVASMALASTAVIAILPAWTLLRNGAREMRLNGQSIGQTVSHARVSRTLMVMQVALAMVLISTASMLMGTFLKLRSVPSGVEPKQLSVFQVTLKGNRYANSLRTSQFVDTVLEELRHEPGVDRVAAINGLPLDRGLNDQGYPTGRVELEQTLEFRTITPGYFAAMGVPLLMGRDISESDRAGSDPVVVVGAATVKKWWPHQSPIGQLIHYGDGRDRRVVGVVADVHTNSLVENDGIVVYAPMTQVSDDLTAALNGWFPTSFVMRTSARLPLAEMVRQAIAKADPEIPLAKLTTMQAVIDGTMQQPRFLSMLSSGLSGFALVLTVIGMFGLLSYQVTQRTREIGVRMALGADRFAILRVFLIRGVALAAIGVAVGCVASWWSRPVIQHLLLDAGVDTRGNAAGSVSVAMNGTEAMMIAVGAILLASMAASWLPARRAASVEPMQALRAE